MLEVAWIERKMGVRLGLIFGEAIKDRKRRIRKPVDGVMTFVDAPLPVRIHGKGHREGDGDVRKRASSGETG
ncbi:MAG: hypothetical protein ACYSU0_05075 [Planctomycetota bacterium]